MPEDGIYRTILWAMVLTVMAGAVFAILGETLFHNPDMTRVGAGVAFIGGAIYACFRWLGAREAQRGESGGYGSGSYGSGRDGSSGDGDSDA